MINNGKKELNRLIAIQLSNSLRGSIISPILALFIHEHGFSLTEIGFLGTASVLGWLIFEPLMGVFADKLNKKNLISFSIIGSSLVYVLYPLASSFLHFSILAFSLTSIMSAYAISVKSLVAELIPAENRGKAYGRYTAIISLGGIVGPFFGGYVAEKMGNNIPFFIASILGIVSLILVLSMKISIEKTSELKDENNSISELFSGSLMGIYLVRAVFLFNLMFRQYSLPIYLNKDSGFKATKSEIGAFLSIVSFSSTLSKTFLGDMVDKYGSRFMMASSIAFLSLTYITLIFLYRVEGLYGLGLVQGMVMSAAELSMMIYLMSIIPKGRTGMVMGLYSEAENVGAIIGAPFFGYLYDNQGPKDTIIAISIILFINAIIAWLTVKKE